MVTLSIWIAFYWIFLLRDDRKNNQPRLPQKKNTAWKDFNFGFCDVYPEYLSSSRSYKDADMPLVKEFRDRVRNGIYHLTFTKKSVLIHNDPNTSGKDFDVIQQKDEAIYAVNPHLMIRTIVNHFPGFIGRLYSANLQYDGMHNKFVKFFDEFYDV